MYIMKIAVLLLLAALTISNDLALAEEVPAELDSGSDAYYKKYCTELAEQAGIENEEEFRQYVKDCLESYLGPASE